MDITMIGIDIAKNVFQLCGTNREGKVILKKRLTRKQLLPTIAQLAPCLIAMESCSGAHHWYRTFTQFGHTVKLITPQMK